MLFLFGIVGGMNFDYEGLTKRFLSDIGNLLRQIRKLVNLTENPINLPFNK